MSPRRSAGRMFRSTEGLHLVHVRKQPVVSRRQLRAPLVETVQLLELTDADSRLNVHHVVFESRDYHFVVSESVIGESLPRPSGKTMKRIAFNHLSPILTVCSDHPSLTGGHILGDVKTKNRQVTNPADSSAVVMGFDGMGGVFNHQEVVTVSDLQDAIHRTGPTG